MTARLQRASVDIDTESASSCSLKLKHNPYQIPNTATPVVSKDRVAVASGATDHMTDVMVHAMNRAIAVNGQRARRSCHTCIERPTRNIPVKATSPIGMTYG